jgi:hypothetical protein
MAVQIILIVVWVAVLLAIMLYGVFTEGRR